MKIGIHDEFCHIVLQYIKKAALWFPLAATFIGLGSSGYAQHWVQTSAPMTNWADIKCSADGTRVMALGSSSSAPGTIFLSTNSGVAWTQTGAPVKYWNSLAMSADGTTIAAVASGFDEPESIYISTNSGASWIPHSPDYWSSVTCSADGTKMFAANYVDNGLYRSLDSGITWTSNRSAVALAISSDGQKAVGVSQTSFNWFESWSTTNGGASWDQIDGPPNSNSGLRIACSGEASRFVLSSSYLGIYTSTNLGQTWEQSSIYGDEHWNAVGCSSDGTRMIAAAIADTDRAGGIYTSPDSGASWVLNDALPAFYTAVAISADGTKLFAAAFRGGIYTSQPVVPPDLSIAFEQGNVVLSWNAPANVVLEQKADLKTTNWMEVTTKPILTNGLYRLVLPVSGGNMFYRLKGS